MRLKQTDQRTMISSVKALAPAIQGGGAALLLEGHVELVARAGADGAHLTGIEAMAEALPSLKPDRIAGVGGLSTRHDSMAAGEAGADYVLFGEPDAEGPAALGRGDRRAPGWWAELFEPPCVGYAASLEEAREFAAAGADFVLVGDFIWADPRGAAAALKDAEETIWEAHAAAFRKSQSRTGITPEMKILRPYRSWRCCLTVAGRRRGANLADAAGRPAAAGRSQPRPPKEKPSQSRRRPPRNPLRPRRRNPRQRLRQRRPSLPPPSSKTPTSTWFTAPISAAMYKTAFDLATNRAQFNGDPKAMTMLGELYANAMGVKRDYAKAAEWYKRAADGGDREGMFALAMLRLCGRGGAVNREEAVKLLASSAKLGNPKAAYNLALLYLDGQTLPQDVKRAAELLRVAADAGNPEAQYALATFYKEGTGVAKDIDKAVRLLQAASLAGNVDAEVEYAIALFNGTGTPKNEAAAVALLRKAARQNSPIAQNRLARVLVSGEGAPMDKIEGLKWHIVAKTAGKGDPMLDEALAALSPEDRAKAQEAARKWLGTK